MSRLQQSFIANGTKRRYSESDIVHLEGPGGLTRMEKDIDDRRKMIVKWMKV